MARTVDVSVGLTIIGSSNMSNSKPSDASDQSASKSSSLPNNPSDVAHAAENNTNLVHEEPVMAAATSLGGAGLDETPSNKTYCVVVVGKTGSGKSTVCNALLDTDENIFPVSSGFVGSTTKPQKEVNKKHGIHVVDTPDVFSMGYKSEDFPHKFAESDKLCPSDARTAFLFTIRFDRRFTPQDYNLYSNYFKLLPAKYRRNTIMVQVKAEQFEDAEKEMEDSSLKKVREEFGDRIVVFPQSTSPQSREKFISDVLEHLNKIEFVNPDSFVDVRNISSTERPDRDQKSCVSPHDRNEKFCESPPCCSLM